MASAIPLVDMRAQYQTLRDEIRASWDEILDTMHLFLGKNCDAFEREFADFCGTRFGCAVNSGTDALHLALRAVGVREGDEVITVSHTFIATVEAIIQAGARPVLVDVEADTCNMDVAQVEKKINRRTKAILPVHLYGQPVDMDPLLDVARRHDLRVVEDACQAHGALYKGKPAGSLGDAGCFSFYFSKNLGAYGEAGMVVTDDPGVARQVSLLRNHGQETRYVHPVMGYNCRIDELQAAVLRIKLRRLSTWNELRRRHAATYTELLGESDLTLPKEAPYAKHAYHLYVIRSRERDELRHWLSERGVETGIHYPIPVHLQAAFTPYSRPGDDLVITEQVARTVLSLPMYPELTDEQISTVVGAIKDYLERR
ncbi:MAG: DegT/DnrJ/EryC1/StrS family aminotransferase [Chloroflexi bacterium]|nr:DegT/DnrJ/EryC1/StrS family aminotransferase [Chloroflexota bacterium]